MESQLLSIEYLKQQPRWDFRYFDPKYLEVEKLLCEGKYPLESLDRFTRQIQNFGAYSSCNLLKWVEDEDSIPYLKITNLKEDEIDWSDVLKITPTVHNKLPKSKVYPGDVLYSMAGTIGLAVLAPENLGECNSNQAIAKIRLKQDTLNPNYLVAFLNSRLGRYQSERIANGQTVLNINLGEIGKLLVPVPPRSLQDQIAQMMQEAYRDRQRKLEEAEASFLGIEAYVHETLDITKDFPIDEPRFLVNQSQLHRWDVRFFLPSFSHLEDFIEKGKYPTKSLLTIREKITNGLTPAKIGYTDEGCVVVKVASLTKLFQINWDKVAFTSTEFFKKAKKAHIKDGDLLILSASHQLDYIGRSFALVRDIPTDYVNQCMAVGELILIRSNPQLVLPEYLLACFTMQPIQKLINRMTRGQSAHLYAEDLQHLKIPVPPLDVQQTIIDEMDRRRSEAKRLRIEAEAVVAAAKARVERMILGEEEIGEN